LTGLGDCESFFPAAACGDHNLVSIGTYLYGAIMGGLVDGDTPAAVAFQNKVRGKTVTIAQP